MASPALVVARALRAGGARGGGARGRWAVARSGAEGGSDTPVSPTTPAATLEALERTLGLPAVPPAGEAADARAQLEAQVPGEPAAPAAAAPSFAGSASPATPAATEEPEMELFKIMGFGGPAPEVINGRAAMVGFLAALGAELASHDSVFKQLGEGGLAGMLAVWAAVTAASFAPLARGKSVEETFLKKNPESLGPFKADAEMLNGRAAMMGLLALLVLEGMSGQSFF